jgi:NADP-dependent 3-hydroxy acid dehydrogenase YdfG
VGRVTSHAGLAGSVALVTGASSGIGAATARVLAAEGVAVAVAARRVDRLEDLASEIRSAGGNVLVIEADVTSRQQAEGAVDRAVEEFGRLDILVNNAGVMLLGPILDAPVEEWERMIELNVLGLLYCSKAAIPHLLKAADGPRGVADLVNISSVAGRTVRLGSGVYNASKHAVGAFSESLRQEVTARHLRVSLVEPGAVDTELPTHNREEVRAGLDERFADMERLEDHDIADAIRYLVTRPRHVAINEILIRPTEQAN